jgi:hypothetical protein
MQFDPRLLRRETPMNPALERIAVGFHRSDALPQLIHAIISAGIE